MSRSPVPVRILANRQLELKAIKGLLTVLLFAALVGCGDRAISESGGNALPASPASSIQSVQSASAKDRVVQLQGTVGDRVPLLGSTAYELQDSTGKIWVLTKQLAPAQGQQVSIKGTLRYQSIFLNGKEAGSIYVEQD